MSRHRLKTVCWSLGVVVSLATMASTLRGGEHCWFRCGFSRDKVCVTRVKPGHENTKNWDVECADICIPAVRFPWNTPATMGCDGTGSCVLPKCGRVRSVRKLKKVEGERDTCQYEYTIVCPCTDCRADTGIACVSDRPESCDAGAQPSAALAH